MCLSFPPRCSHTGSSAALRGANAAAAPAPAARPLCPGRPAHGPGTAASCRAPRPWRGRLPARQLPGRLPGPAGAGGPGPARRSGPPRRPAGRRRRRQPGTEARPGRRPAPANVRRFSLQAGCERGPRQAAAPGRAGRDKGAAAPTGSKGRSAVQSWRGAGAGRASVGSFCLS